MIVGFTGTRKGMTGDQAAEIARFLSRGHVTEVHHGDCVGADEQFHDIAFSFAIPIVIHPPTNDSLRAWCSGVEVTILEPEHYIERNRAIVNACDVLLGAPKEAIEPQVARGQGTWSTIRYARKYQCQVQIFWPANN